MKYRCLLIIIIATSVALGGCQMQRSVTAGPVEGGCYTHGIPTLVDNACLLPTWVAFGLKSQTASDSWRDQVLHYMDGDTLREQLVRAEALAWGDPDRWEESIRLFRNNIDRAPVDIRPLLEQWQGELGRRYALQQSDHQQDRDSEQQQSQIKKLQAENDRLSAKLDALTKIEESMNSRPSSQ